MGGSNSTHVANGCNEPIYAKVSAERIAKTLRLGGFERKQTPLDRGNIPDGFVKINPNQFFRFDVNSDNLRWVFYFLNVTANNTTNVL